MVSIRELRKALLDDARAPRFIQTVYGQGFRFLVPVTCTSSVFDSSFMVSGQKAEQRETSSQKRETLLIGRESELAQLRKALEKALGGKRQVVLVTGEAGMGKTALIETFLRKIALMEVRIGRGQC